MSEIDKIQLKDSSGQLIAEYDLPGGSSSDTKVTQTYTNSYSNDHNYELLFSETPADTTTRTEGSRKNYALKFNPYLKALTIGSRFEYDETTFPPEVPYGNNSIVIGENCAAKIDYSFAHGLHAIADGYGSFASGDNVEASNGYAHAEGSYSRAAGYCTHAEGRNTFAYGDSSHAEGYYSSALGNYSHAEGYHTDADSGYQHVQGKYNRIDSNDVYAHIVGNGTANNARSNAYALRWNGQQDVTNDIVRVDTNGTWDGFNASLEDAFKQNLGECNNYDADTGTYYDFYEIAEIVVDPGTAEDSYEHQKDICNPIIFEVSQIVNPTWADSTGYSVLELAFKFNTTTNETELLQFLSSNSLDYRILKDDNDSTIWHLYGQYSTQSGTRYVNKSILHHITGSGFNNNITVVMQNVLGYEEVVSVFTNGTAPTRNFVKTSTAKSFVRNSSIANNYDNTATYDVGDLCFRQGDPYSNVLYVCNTTISTPEDFDSTHWTQVTLPEYFAKQSEAIKNITRSGTTFTATRTDGTTFTFTQQDNNTTYTFATGDSNGQIKVTPSGGSAQNVSVKGLNNAAYKDVFTRSSTGDIGWGTTANRTKVLEASAIAYWNGCYSGTSSNLQYCDRGRFGTIVTKGTGDYLPINPANIEFTNNAWHFLDFHYQGSTDDFTARLIESAKGTMRLYYRVLTNEGYNVANEYGYFRMEHGTGSGVATIRSGGTGLVEFLQTNGYGTWATCKAKAFSVQSSKWIKENINDLTDEEALKLLNLRPVTFDYTDGVTKNCRGLIAEEAYEELPYCVDMPEEYLNLDHDPILEADKDEDTDIGILPSIDYSKFVPHLIKLCQIQQKQIDELTERVTQLEASGFKFEA